MVSISDMLCLTLAETDTHSDMTIRSASYSRLLDFEGCPLRAKLKFIDRIPEEKHPAAERGTAIHLQAEQFVDGTLKELPTTLKHFEEDFLNLRDAHLDGRVSQEGEWGFSADWLPAEYKTAWLRMKADAVVTLSATKALVIDFKTGRKDGNEIKHGEQVQLYAIATLIRNPDLREVDVELWYTDKNDITHKTYKRMEALRYIQSFHTRIVKMLSATEFPANPTVFTCKWCPFSPAKGGQCSFGVAQGESPLTYYRSKFG